MRSKYVTDVDARCDCATANSENFGVVQAMELRVTAVSIRGSIFLFNISPVEGPSRFERRMPRDLVFQAHFSKKTNAP